MDSTVKVAIIASIPGALTGLGTLIYSVLNRKALTNIHVAINSRLSELLVSSIRAAKAEGRREGVESRDA